MDKLSIIVTLLIAYDEPAEWIRRVTFDQFAIDIAPAHMAKISGKRSPALKASPINCCEELMKPNRPPNTSALPSV